MEAQSDGAAGAGRKAHRSALGTGAVGAADRTLAGPELRERTTVLATLAAAQNGTYGTGELGGTVVETSHRLRCEAL